MLIQIKNGQTTQRHFTEEKILMARKYMKQYSMSLLTRNIQIKTTVQYHHSEGYPKAKINK